MAFQSSAFQNNAFQQQDTPAPVVTEHYSGGYFERKRKELTPEQIAAAVHAERVRLGILPKAVVQAVVQVTAKHSLGYDQSLGLLEAELKGIGAQLNAAYIKQFDKAMADKRARDDDDEEAISLLI
jgi:hypothetical protein